MLTCHATLPNGDQSDFGLAVCAGFWVLHRNAVPAGRLAQLFLGILHIQPSHYQSDQEPAALGSPGHPPHDRSRDHAREDESDPGLHPRYGDRIRLVATSDPYTALKPGVLGTVTGADSLGTIHVRWDNSSTPGLIPDLDRFDIIDL